MSFLWEPDHIHTNKFLFRVRWRYMADNGGAYKLYNANVVAKNMTEAITQIKADESLKMEIFDCVVIAEVNS